MASSTLVSSAARIEDIVPRGTRRSRLSLHLNTPRVRRWLLVQLISIPVHEASPARADKRSGIEQRREQSAPSYSQLLDQYQASVLARQCI